MYGINGYGAPRVNVMAANAVDPSSNDYQSALDKAKAASEAARNKTSGGQDLTMQNFLELLTKQMTNQDMMNPQSDTEFIAQMAQFSALQAAQVTNEITYAQYGASMVGKVVGLASFDKKGNLVEEYGVVSVAKLVGGKVTITVNGKEYDISAIMSVRDKMPEPEKPDEVPWTPIEPIVPPDEKPDQGLPEEPETVPPETTP